MRALLLLLVTALPASAVPLPLVCELTSEEIPSIKVLLTERTSVSLKGELLQGSKALGTSRQVNPMATGVSGGLSITSTAKVTEPLCSSKALSTGTLTDEFHARQRRTEFFSWDLLLTSGIGIPMKRLVSSGETETS